LKRALSYNQLNIKQIITWKRKCEYCFFENKTRIAESFTLDNYFN